MVEGDGVHFSKNEIEIRVEHVPGEKNRITNYLSRWHLGDSFQYLAWHELFKLRKFEWKE